MPDHSDPAAPIFVSVALPVPLRRLFDYRAPGQLLPGTRVAVNFANQQLVGVVISCHQSPSVAAEKIRAITHVIDQQPLADSELLSLCAWAANYYHHPLGEVVAAALPQKYRQGDSQFEQVQAWRLTTEAKGLPSDALKRAPKQQQVLQLLLEHHQLSRDQLDDFGINTSTLKTMADRGLLASFTDQQTKPPAEHHPRSEQLLATQPPALTDEQTAALEQIRYHSFGCFLLEGATGSGKTEVYLQIISRVLQANRQALVLIPEIGLSPQTLARFQQRFVCPIVELHSNVSEARRAQNWRAARDGGARIVIGTRLAAFTPFKDLGVIIVDEEHDLSFKQQDGLRYSARDLSIYRAKTLGIPIVLGSATPSLETLHNAIQQRYAHLRLTKRAGQARPPDVQVLDLRGSPMDAGLSREAVAAIGITLSRGEQVIVFLNRRGFAPTLLCHHCGWSAECRNCDSHLTVHRQPPHLHCHHCDAQQPVPHRCPVCNSHDLNPKGLGTEQTEAWLQQQFPEVPVWRIDRDSTQRKNALQDILAEAAEAGPCILIGTQMLAKGHHLPSVTLVVVQDCDQGLMSADFRGPERMGQLIIQVAGRAGRENLPGRVLIQTHAPDHPLLELLLQRGYHRYARELLNERQATGLPPFSHTALFRAESKRVENATAFLKMVAATLLAVAPEQRRGLQLLGPIPARQERIKDRFRYQLQVKSANRGFLHAVLREGLERIDQHALAKRTRWSLDVDPQET